MARKKKAPVIKSNLRDVPAEKFRAVNRMNGIVTMVEYTGEDDIKAYELEPTYRELGGGGGEGINSPKLTINYSQSGDIDNLHFLNLFNTDFKGYALISNNTLTYDTVIEGETGIISVYFIQDMYSSLIISLNPDITSNVAAQNMINCSLEYDEEDGYSIVINNITEDASIDIMYQVTI